MGDDVPRGWTQIATLADFGTSRQLVVAYGGLSILLRKLNAGLNGGLVALNNVCTHLGQPLAGGRVIAGQIICPFHGACFDLHTGAALSGPAVLPLHRFPVRVDGDAVWVDLSKRPSVFPATSIGQT